MYIYSYNTTTAVITTTTTTAVQHQQQQQQQHHHHHHRRHRRYRRSPPRLHRDSTCRDCRVFAASARNSGRAVIRVCSHVTATSYRRYRRSLSIVVGQMSVNWRVSRDAAITGARRRNHVKEVRLRAYSRTRVHRTPRRAASRRRGAPRPSHPPVTRRGKPPQTAASSS